MNAKILLDLVPVHYIVYTVLTIVFLVTIIVKVYPVVSNWFKATNERARNYQDLVDAVKKNSEDIKHISDRVYKDADRLDQIQQITIKQQKYIESSLEERKLILKSLLGVVQGLQEIGANGPTKQAEAEIQSYLISQAHLINDNEF